MRNRCVVCWKPAKAGHRTCGRAPCVSRLLAAEHIRELVKAGTRALAVLPQDGPEWWDLRGALMRAGAVGL